MNVVYRRSERLMPAEEKEIKEAKKEGINFLFQNNIVKILGNRRVEEVELIRTELVKKEGEEREVPVNIDGTNYKIGADYVVMALGASTSEEVKELGLELDKRNNIKIDEKYQTSNKNIFAGGNLAGCKSTVAWTAFSGREAANNILEYLKSEN